MIQSCADRHQTCSQAWDCAHRPDIQLQSDEWLRPAQELRCKALLVKPLLGILCGSMDLDQALPALAT